MLREPNTMEVTIGTTVAASTEIPMTYFAGGSFELPATSGTTQITVYAQVGSEAYGIMQDDDWVAVSAKSVSVSTPYPLPPNSFNFPRIKLVASAGTATTNVPVHLKS
jgi:hypothetical protein